MKIRQAFKIWYSENPYWQKRQLNFTTAVKADHRIDKSLCIIGSFLKKKYKK